MIASMFNLDHRLSELRPTRDERRLARRPVADALPASRPAVPTGELRSRGLRSVVVSPLARLAAG
jgi:hypothetical protein